jgi:16S rRNA processing protein RimM
VAVEWLQIGYVARAHGLRGELAVRLFDPESHALFEASKLQLKLRTGKVQVMELRASRPAAKEVLVQLEAVSDRTAAESLVGAQVSVHRDELEALSEGELFQGDLIGMEVFDLQGHKAGEVAGLWETGPVPNLVVRGEGLGDSGELLIPFVDDFVPELDIEGRKLVIRRPEFLE